MIRLPSLRQSSVAFAMLIAIPSLAWGAVDLPDNFQNNVILTGLQEPTSLAFLPDGRVLFTEQRNGKVRMMVNGHIAATDPVLVVPNLNNSGYERGLQGIAVDPNWPGRPFIYLCLTRIGSRMRIVRYTASGDLTNATGESLTLSSPMILIDDIPDVGANHNAGCMRFGPDNHLFVSLGDDQDFCGSVDPKYLRGSILRLWVDALPATGGGVSQVPRATITPLDNPLATADTNAALVWAYGMRNPWRFQIDPVTRLIYGGDVGEQDFEEINEIEPGDWLGWPYREGNLIMPRATCPEPGGAGTTPYQTPIVAIDRGPEEYAVISAGVYRPSYMTGALNWPAEYHGQALYGDYYAGNLQRIRKVAGSWQPAPAAPGQPNATFWMTGLVSAVEYLLGPDGSLWYLRQFDDVFNPSSGSLGRIRYIGDVVGVGAERPSRSGVSISPNPFRASAEVAFRVERAERVRAEVFDLSGRRVRRLMDGEVAAGLARLGWDGNDDDGRPAPPGLYAVRIERAGGIETARVLRVR